ncbi:unnamed protein product [Rhizophagus irregularis]|nr:unnamed protein product [Rhizophagus irregularis]CAB4446574.1 unnamed protein product [Rhizophagus irregularis]
MLNQETVSRNYPAFHYGAYNICINKLSHIPYKKNFGKTLIHAAQSIVQTYGTLIKVQHNLTTFHPDQSFIIQKNIFISKKLILQR